MGKTTIAAALVHDEEIRSSFEKILWVSVGQEPDIRELQDSLFFQITGHHFSDDVKKADEALKAVRDAAKSCNVLLVLDDVWDPKHEKPLNCIDPDNASRLLVTTRIRGLLKHASEVDVGVLSAEEALMLLVASAEMIDEDRNDWIPIIVDSMLEEERSWRLAESIGIVAKSTSRWPKGSARSTIIEHLISLTGGLPAGKDRVDALKSISSRVPERHLPELMLLAIENHGLEAKAARPVIKAMVQSRNHDILKDIKEALHKPNADRIRNTIGACGKPS